MGILIRDLNMPPAGEYKHIRIYSDGDVTIDVSNEEAIIAKAVQSDMTIPEINIPDLRQKLTELLEIEERNQVFYMTSHERNEFQTAVNLVLDFAECMKKDYGYE